MMHHVNDNSGGEYITILSKQTIQTSKQYSSSAARLDLKGKDGSALMDLSKAFGITDVAEMTDRVGDRQSRKEIRVLMPLMFISQ